MSGLSSTLPVGSLSCDSCFFYDIYYYSVVEPAHSIDGKDYVVCRCFGSTRKFSDGFILSIFFFAASTQVFPVDRRSIE